MRTPGKLSTSITFVFSKKKKVYEKRIFYIPPSSPFSWLEFLCVMDWAFVVTSPKSSVEVPSPNGAFGNGAFGGWLDQEGRALTQEISVLIGRDATEPALSFPTWGAVRRQALCSLGGELAPETKLTGTLLMNFWPPELGENKSLWLKAPTL